LSLLVLHLGEQGAESAACAALDQGIELARLAADEAGG
jgi:hypothetical protein